MGRDAPGHVEPRAAWESWFSSLRRKVLEDMFHRPVWEEQDPGRRWQAQQARPSAAPGSTSLAELPWPLWFCVATRESRGTRGSAWPSSEHLFPANSDLNDCEKCLPAGIQIVNLETEADEKETFHHTLSRAGVHLLVQAPLVQRAQPTYQSLLRHLIA